MLKFLNGIENHTRIVLILQNFAFKCRFVIMVYQLCITMSIDFRD